MTVIHREGDGAIIVDEELAEEETTAFKGDAQSLMVRIQVNKFLLSLYRCSKI